MDKVYIVETTHESGEKERREVEATHIIEAFQKGTYDCYATMVIVKEKVSRDYKAEIAYLTAENERLRGEVEEQKSIAEHEHASQMEWFSIAGDYKAENAELRARLEKAVELPVKVGDTVCCIRNCRTGRYRVEEHTVTEIVFEYDNQMRIKTSYGLFGCEKWTFGLDCFADPAEAEALLKELKEEEI